MNEQMKNIDELFAKIAADDLDSLVPEDVARFEQIANNDPAIADKLAQMPAGKTDFVDVPDVDEYEWTLAWSNIEQAAKPLRKRPAWLRPLSAVAAVVMMLGIWSLTSQATDNDWKIALDTDVEIVSLECFGDDMPVITTAGSDDEFFVIRVVEGEGV